MTNDDWRPGYKILTNNSGVLLSWNCGTGNVSNGDNLCDTPEKALQSPLVVRYDVGFITKPKTNCGPLQAFRTVRDVVMFMEAHNNVFYGFFGAKISCVAKCEYLFSPERELWVDIPRTQPISVAWGVTCSAIRLVEEPLSIEEFGLVNNLVKMGNRNNWFWAMSSDENKEDLLKNVQ